MAEKAKTKLAIIKNVTCGVDESDKGWLRFDAYISEHEHRNLIFSWEQAETFMRVYNTYHVFGLEGQPTWVKVNRGSRSIRWDRPWVTLETADAIELGME
jgi:hypothetical protein